MKKIDYLIIVNTDTPGGQEITKGDLIEYHTSPEHLGGLGLNRPKIDDLISLDGELIPIIPETNMTDVDMWGISDGLEPLNGQAKYVVFVGGKTKDGKKDWDTRTNEQKETLETYLKFHILKHPKILVMGLDSIPALEGAEMPSFNVPKWLDSIGIEENNIFKNQ
jgi:N-acetylmuramoyl-L-alanine amidase